MKLFSPKDINLNNIIIIVLIKNSIFFYWKFKENQKMKKKKTGNSILIANSAIKLESYEDSAPNVHLKMYYVFDELTTKPGTYSICELARGIWKWFNVLENGFYQLCVTYRWDTIISSAIGAIKHLKSKQV